MQKKKLVVIEEEIVDILEEEAGAYDIPLQQTISENQNNSRQVTKRTKKVYRQGSRKSRKKKNGCFREYHT